MRRHFLLTPAFLLIFIGSAFATLSFPTLTGRVVDEAGILSQPAKQNLEQNLADYEKQSTNQIVVVTLRTLRGTSIEDYGYQLGRSWGIGQKGKDNGALLIVAPKEHKVRIEVGYGLEGVLTDALSSEIIQGIILPDFRAGQMEKGVVDGTHAILDALGGKEISANNPASTKSPYPDAHDNRWAGGTFLLVWLCLFLFRFWFFPFLLMGSGHRPGTGYLGGGFGGSGFGGGGGFSGGGGGFGGGGASGGW